MKKKNGSKSILSFVREYALSFLLFCGVGGFAFVGLQETKTAQQEEGLRIARESILRAAVSCYALEGVYPPSYEYLKEHYNIRINEEKYAVFYEIFASNMMPDVTVVEK